MLITDAARTTGLALDVEAWYRLQHWQIASGTLLVDMLWLQNAFGVYRIAKHAFCHADWGKGGPRRVDELVYWIANAPKHESPNETWPHDY